MKKFSTLLVASALIAVMMSIFATKVNAQVSQSQQLEQTTTCATGSYGQNTTCTVTQTGRQNQEARPVIYRSNGTPVVVHQPVNAAVNPEVMVAGVITMITSGAGAVLTLKKKIA